MHIWQFLYHFLKDISVVFLAQLLFDVIPWWEDELPGTCGRN